MDRLLQAVREGRSGVLVLRGEAGVGKSALLAYAGDRAVGVTVLRAAGVEAEVELPFAALHQLLRSLLGRLGRLPAPQAGALQAAFGLAAAPGHDREGGRPGDRFLLSVGVLSLLADAAEQRPLVCLLDDAHWLDRASADALVFAGRRLGAESIGLLFAARDAQPRGFDAPGLPELRVAGLDSKAAAGLLADTVPSAPAAQVRDRLLTAAGGNPLALLELPAAPNRRGSASRAANSRPMPSAPSRLPANTKASADAWSSQCASSSRQTSGRCSAASASSDSTPTDTRNRSPGRSPGELRSPGAAASPNAACSATACGAGRRPNWSSSGRSSWCSAANGSSTSASTPAARNTVTPTAWSPAA